MVSFVITDISVYKAKVSMIDGQTRYGFQLFEYYLLACIHKYHAQRSLNAMQVLGKCQQFRR